MDKREENVADFDRYAFLLGSALRSDDLEQFFCIYDSIIPKQISEFQVEKIKERAREIAELPEDDFNQLVVKARDYSLAHGQPPPSSVAAMWTSSGQAVTNHVAEKKEGQGEHPCSDVPKLPLHSPAFPSPCQAVGVRDDDSGLPSSTSFGPGLTSVSSDEVLDMEERGAYDYFPQPTPSSQISPKEDQVEVPSDTKVKCHVGKPVSVGDMYDANHYDEAMSVENDSDSIESPRSDSGENQPPCSVLGRVEERVGRDRKAASGSTFCDPEQQDDNIHKKLYARKNFGRASSTSPFRRSSLGKGLSSSASGSSAGHDSNTCFTSLAGSSGQSRHSPDYLSALADVPLSPSILSHLAQNSSYNLSNKSVASSAAAAGEGKKKKKKKKEAKDETTHEEGSLIKSFDENGNPLPPVSRKQYLRLRQSSSSQQKASTDSSSLAIINNELATHKVDHQGMGNKSDDPQNACQPLAASSCSDKRKRRRNGIQSKSVQAQYYPNYVGDCKDVDRLVKFINNDISKKELKKSGNSSADSSDHGTSVVNNTSHKNEKSRPSSKQLLTTGVGENSEDGLTPASETTQLLRSTTSFTTYSSVNDHSSLLAACRNTPSEQSHTEEQEANSEIAQKVPVDMGNIAAAEKQLDTAEIALPDSVKVVENHISDITSTSSSLETKLTNPESQPNNMLSTFKSETVGKKGLVAEGKDKGKSRNGGTNNHKKDSAHHIDNNHLNKKTKSKSLKPVGKAETLSEKVPFAGAQEEKGSASEDAGLSYDSEKAAAFHIVSDSSAMHNAIYNDSVFSNGPLSARDEEFTVVSTKKKKRAVQSRVQNITAQSSSHPYLHKDSDLSYPSSQFSPDSFSYNRRSHWETYSRRQNPQSQYHTSSPPPQPPPPSSSLEKVTGVERPEMVQDLSQSAFPALNPSDRSCGLFQLLGQEARSLEDLPCGVGQLSFDKDSDKASSKSLPAIQGKGNKSRVNYPVSYASMASANTPRQSVDSSQAASISSSMGGSNGEEMAVTPTTAIKWKGSPQERRHSIGSAPEDLSKVVSGSNLQRTGSQEMLPRDKDSPDKSSKTLASPVNVPAGNGVDSPVGCGASPEETWESAIAYPTTSALSDSTQTVPTTEVQAQAVVSGSATDSIPTTHTSPYSCGGTVTVTSVASGPSSSHQPSHEPCRTRGTQPSSSSRSQSVPGITQNKAKLVKPVNNGNKKKIVIFCDDSEEESRGCDYSFGDLPVYWTSGGSLVMPSGSESVSIAESASKETVTVELVSPPRCPTIDTAAAANLCGLSRASSSHTVSGNVSLEMPSGNSGSEDKYATSSSQNNSHLIKGTSGSASLGDQPTASDSKSSDLSTECDVNTVNFGTATPASSATSDINLSVKSCDRALSKQSKGVHIAGLNGVIPVQGLVVSRATVTVATCVPATSHTPVVSTSASIPPNSSDSFHAQTDELKKTSAGAMTGPESESLPSLVQSTKIEQGTETASSGSMENNSQRSGGHILFPDKSPCFVYLPVQEAFDQQRQQIQDDNLKFLTKGWSAALDNLRENPDKVVRCSSDTLCMMKTDRA